MTAIGDAFLWLAEGLKTLTYLLFDAIVQVGEFLFSALMSLGPYAVALGLVAVVVLTLLGLMRSRKSDDLEAVKEESP
jgi:nitrogen fixation-related uncharacterized protein